MSATLFDSRRLLRGASAVADLLLPRYCVACSRPLGQHETGLVCGRCWARLVLLPMPQCARCGHPHVAHSCRWCDLLPPFVRAVRSVCWVPEAAAGHIVHALKYDGWHAVANEMARRMARLSWPSDVVDERAALVPVPLARTRERERGFNQSALLASALGKQWRIPVWTECVQRTRHTDTQTRLTPGERLRNVAGAFEVSGDRSAQLRGAHIVIVDDVVTTAATLNACAHALMRAGARIVSYVTFGRARAMGDGLP
jgi:ComF family protein